MPHCFYSPISNQRTDEYGGSSDNQIRFLREVVKEVRQVWNAAAVREGADIPVAAVGLINDPELADEIIRHGKADMVMLARELLRNPYWPQHAAIKLKRTRNARVPVQYHLAWRDMGQFDYLPVSAPTLD